MDTTVVEQKLESLRRCVHRIEIKCPADPAELAASLKKAVGFRNIAVHSYNAINWRMVHRIAHDHLSDFTAFARVVSARLV